MMHKNHIMIYASSWYNASLPSHSLMIQLYHEFPYKTISLCLSLDKRLLITNNEISKEFLVGTSIVLLPFQWECGLVSCRAWYFVNQGSSSNPTYQYLIAIKNCRYKLINKWNTLFPSGPKDQQLSGGRPARRTPRPVLDTRGWFPQGLRVTVQPLAALQEGSCRRHLAVSSRLSR
jgi:hypothetical protein